MSLTFSPNGTNVSSLVLEKHKAEVNLAKTAGDVDVMIASLCHIQKITPDEEFKQFYQGALTALMWVRHKIGIIQASEASRELLRGVRNG